MFFKKKPRNLKRKEPLSRRAFRAVKSKSAARIFKIGIFLFAALFVVFGARYLYDELLMSPYLAINEVKISGNTKVSRPEILWMAGVNTGDNMLKISAAEIKKGLRRSPWISEVNITRKFPDRLNIEIKERKPVAFINLDSLYLVDETGVIFKKASMDDDIDLPVITGLKREDIEEGAAGVLSQNARSAKASELAILAVNLIHLSAGKGIFTNEDISEINIDTTYGLTLYTMQHGTRIELGDGDVEDKLTRLAKVIQQRNGFAGVEFVGFNYNKGVAMRFNTITNYTLGIRNDVNTKTRIPTHNS